MSLEETIIIQNLVNNDYIVQKEFYDKYKKIIFNYIKSKYPANQEIEDDVSEILIKIFLGLSTFNPEKSKIKTWVINITKNYMIDKWRTSKPQSLPENSNICDTYSFFDNFEAENMLTHISNQMKPKEYTILNMKYYSGYELSEIDSEFNLPSGKAWSEIKKIKYRYKKSKLNAY